jgi:3D (Asp-Asp-Asp) domain-containing protein
MILSRSFRRRALATSGAALGILFLYEATVFDSRAVTTDWASSAEVLEPSPGARLTFEATAYCKGRTTKSGVRVRPGIAAADPTVLPLGSIIEVRGIPEEYAGIYSVLDTGPEIRGRDLDIYIWSCYDALDFGRQNVEVTVLRLGWHQGNTAAENR